MTASVTGVILSCSKAACRTTMIRLPQMGGVCSKHRKDGTSIQYFNQHTRKEENIW
jgi:hypothetical protein